jgi:hypothetical protein
MSEAACLHGAFFGFTDEMRDAKINALTEVINQHVEYGISVSVRLDHYCSIVGEVISRSYDTPYLFASTQAIVAVVNAERHLLRNNPINFVFDDMNKTEFLEILESWQGFQGNR